VLNLIALCGSFDEQFRKKLLKSLVFSICKTENQQSWKIPAL